MRLDSDDQPGIGGMTLNLAEQGARLLGATLHRQSVVGGGSLSDVVEIELSDGQTAIVKGGPAPAIEAKMLDAIRATGAPVPAVLAKDDAVLVLERLPTRGQIDDAWHDLGAVLAQLHGAAPESEAHDRPHRYGWQTDYGFGKVGIANAWTDNWPAFWAERRLANQTPHLPKDIASRVERLAGQLADYLPAKPPPALLHGDLWGGNILVADGRISGLIDPACYYGDREVDFAMLQLFNRPGRQLFAVCDSLEPGHEARLPIYQLWPALVHFRLFGSGYREMVERMLSLADV